jgi:hypothetical protein
MGINKLDKLYESFKNTYGQNKKSKANSDVLIDIRTESKDRWYELNPDLFKAIDIVNRTFALHNNNAAALLILAYFDNLDGKRDNLISLNKLGVFLNNIKNKGEIGRASCRERVYRAV